MGDSAAMVTKVSGQAQAYGIKPNWSIVLVNGNEVTSHAEVREEFNRARKLGKKYPVTFMKDANAIRAEAAMKDAKAAEKAKNDAEKKREEEKKAKEKADAAAKTEAEKAAKKDAYWDSQKVEGAPAEEGYTGPDTSANVGASGTVEDQYMRVDKNDKGEMDAYNAKKEELKAEGTA